MPIERRCNDCCFSTYATGPGRPVLICRQKAGSEGRWKICSPLHKCPNFYPSRASISQNKRPRLIPLTRGQFAIVDADDYPRLNRFIWFAEGARNKYYAVRKENGKSIKMHCQIMGLSSTSTAKSSTLKIHNCHRNLADGIVVDHIDHNGLNNQKSNLRLATFTQNCRNQRRSSHGTSKYKGVCWNKGCKKWAAAIRCDGKTYHLGYFEDETAAARAYDSAAKKYHGDFACLNFS